MAEDESPAKQNLRLAVALLDNDERALEEILRLYGPDILDTLLNEFGTVDSYRFDALSRLGGISYGAIGEKWDVARGGPG